MNTHLLRPMRHLLIAFATIVLTASVVSAGPAQFVIVNLNAPGVGFNDPTPVVPVGGNTGTTVGEQRLIAFHYAASLWTARLDSTVPIRIQAEFAPLVPGVLGSAGALAGFATFRMLHCPALGITPPLRISWQASIWIRSSTTSPHFSVPTSTSTSGSTTTTAR